MGGLFDLEEKKKRREELQEEINKEHFWSREDRETILKEENSLNNTINNYESLNKQINDNINLLNEEIDDELLEIVNNELQNLKESVEKLRIETYLNGKYDKNDCLLEIHSGAGGTEACDWAEMLLRMYTRYFSKNGYKYEELDCQPGDEAGIKSVLLSVKGLNAYGYLKGERGVHRLVRISPFDAGNRRHTSFASVEVTPKFDNTINIDIKDSDIRIDIYRSGGPGGQGVNTTDSAVRITHFKTGIVVTCQNERSQIRNKEIALEILKSKLYNLELLKKNEELNNMKSDEMTISFGSAKRSYVMCPYTLVKDNISEYSTSNVEAILDGEIGEMLEMNIRS